MSPARSSPERRGVARAFSQGAVEEVGVLASDYGPEFGFSMGGVVNGATYSGGNAFHGRFTIICSRNTFSAPDNYAAGYDLQQRRNQGGGGIGGPILKNNLFFFANAK